jgi:hypothetical protein
VSRCEEYRAALAALDRTAWPAYLVARSGLPGPRANLSLVQAVADAGDPETFEMLLGTGEEYLTMCGVVGLGALLAAGDHAVEERLRVLARDDRWRVREGVAMALQRLGDADLPRLLRLAEDWVGDPHPLTQRAAAAGLCEPRLLTTPEAAATAVGVCRRATDALAALPPGRRRDVHVRVLRQGLGYCWSVAVAADPAPGLAAFAELGRSDDPDVAWVVRENRKKRRLAVLAPATGSRR